MNDFTTEILKTLANKGDLNELFRVAICQYSCRNSSVLMYPILSPGETLPLPS